MRAGVDSRRLTAYAERLAQFVGRARQRIKDEMQAIGFDYVRTVRTDKLSGQVLNRRSGWLSQNIGAQVRDNGNDMRLHAGVFGGVPYAGVHEYGFEGDVVVPAYVRKDGASVRSYTRHMKVKQRSYLRSTLAERHQEYAKRILKAATPVRKQS